MAEFFIFHFLKFPIFPLFAKTGDPFSFSSGIISRMMLNHILMISLS